LQESDVAGFGLFEADQKFAVSVEPGVGSFYDPAAMAKAYSDDVRRRFLSAYEQGEGTLDELVERFMVSLAYGKK